MPALLQMTALFAALMFAGWLVYLPFGTLLLIILGFGAVSFSVFLFTGKLL